MPKLFILALALSFYAGHHAAAEAVLLDDQFELPPGFHIFKAADADLTGGSYDITFDGQGRLLVGDGNAVRRLTDTDGDQVYDQQEVIARGLGGRGPQGLLVFGDKLYAVGGDGIQLFSGYESGGPLQHEGRLGQPFNTGGDHAAHTVLRGLDDYIYFVCGDGGGTEDQRHITTDSSPVIYERNGSVFRFDPAGKRWECISAGGRNAPSLGMNYLGEFFSFDSDMEWHVGLPWYRPVRLNHWAIGGDQGWQSVGAYPPYYIDNLPPVLEAGRGSPNWGVFYEHTQFPARYADAFLCCDYRWKSATSGGYNSSGRLVAFHLSRDGASWKATMETLAKSKPNAVDSHGQAINFALVDVDVAPDGSIFVSDHNQGLWRIFYEQENDTSADRPLIPPVVPSAPVVAAPAATALVFTDLVRTPQLGSERSRLRVQNWIDQQGGWGSSSQPGSVTSRLMALAESSDHSLRERLNAIRLLAPQFTTLNSRHPRQLAVDECVEIRAQAAWLLGLRRQENETSLLITLLEDKDPFVRRRAAEALGRVNASQSNAALVRALGDPIRAVRYAAMTAIAHRPADEWLPLALGSTQPQVWMRALVAGTIRREDIATKHVREVVNRLLNFRLQTKEDRLDFLRVLDLFRNQLRDNKALLERIEAYVLAGIPDADDQLRWEHARLAGEYRIAQAIDPLLNLLVADSTPDVNRFHIADALSRIDSGWRPEQEKRLFDWLVTTQAGWFAEFEGKGRQFPQFWATVLDRIVDGHTATVEAYADAYKSGSQLARMAYGILATTQSGQLKLRDILSRSEPDARRDIVRSLARYRVHEALWSDMLRELLRDDRDSQRALAEWIHAQQVSIESYANQLQSARGDGMADAQLLAHRLLSLLEERRDVERGVRALETLFSDEAPAGNVRRTEKDLRNRENQLAAQEQWQAWYRDRFGVPFLVKPRGDAQQRLADEAIHRLVIDATDAGDANRGRNIYLQASCYSCHGGLTDKAVAVFGPDLAGVTKRLKPTELADAIVYPSKQVAERFRNTLVVTEDGKSHTGVLTERNDQQLVLVNTDNEVTRIAMADMEEVSALETSPMPDKLLNRFDANQLQDLLAFLRSLN